MRRMSMSRRLLAGIAVIIASAVLVLTGCSVKVEDTRDNSWQFYNAVLPDFATAASGDNKVFASRDEALSAGGGWYYTVDEDFDYDSTQELFYDPEANPDSIWTYSPHALRWEPNGEKSKSYDDWKNKNKEKANWWCPDMIEVRDGQVLIKAAQYTKSNPHICSAGVCPSEGRFTSGIETRSIVSDPHDATSVKAGASNDKLLFSQAYGYYECKVKFPDTDGMWSAFWLQSSYQRKIGHGGTDGTEIDIFESAFRSSNSAKKSWMGHALLWDGYAEYSRVSGVLLPLESNNLYDGYHTFALKWTPTHYVFYIDGIATWATNAGGVSRVAEFLRLTCEIDAGDKVGPHGMKIGKFAPKSSEDSTFYIDYVKVLQHTSFEAHIMDDDDFAGELDGKN